MTSRLAQTEAVPPKVLVVEDEPGLRFLVSDYLTHDHGLVVVEAASGDQAIDLLKHDTDIKCVFTDVRMPGELDGLALSRRVLAHHPGIKVLVTSGYLGSSQELGGLPFVSKPYDLTRVAALIQQLIKSLEPAGT